MKNSLNKKLKRTFVIASLVSGLALTGCAGITESEQSEITYTYIGNSIFVEHHESDKFTLSKVQAKDSPSAECLVQYKATDYSDLPLGAIGQVINDHSCDVLEFTPASSKRLSGIPKPFSSLALAWDNRGDETVCKVTGGTKPDLYQDMYLEELAKHFLPDCKHIEVIHSEVNPLTGAE